MRSIPKTNKVTAESRAIRQFVKILDQIGAGLRREAHRTQHQQCFLQWAHGTGVSVNRSENGSE
jgi:hypothetical protein